MSIILFLFLGNVRGAIIVALTIPFSLLFAAICLDLQPHSRQSALAGRAGLRHGGRRRRGDGRKHRPPSGPRRTTRARLRKRSAKPRTKCSGRSSLPAASSSPPICPSSRCRPWKAGSSSPWRGRWLSRCSARCVFSMLLAPVLASFALQQGRKGVEEPGHGVAHATTIASASARPFDHRNSTLGICVPSCCLAIYLAFGGPIGSEFLPHLDEGSHLGARHAAAQRRPHRQHRLHQQGARIVMASFPEVTAGAPARPAAPTTEPITPASSIPNTSSTSSPKKQWRPIFHQNKDNLIAAMDKELREVSRRHLGLLAAHLRQHGRGGQRRQGRAGRQALRRRPAHAGGQGRRDPGADGNRARALRIWASSASSASPT